MELELSYRKARSADLQAIVNLLSDDILGKSREDISNKLNTNYIKDFNAIDSDPNQYLMVVILQQEIIGTCHLTMLPSLTFQGSLRMQIEAVRVSNKYRGLNAGKFMIKKALEYAKNQGVKIVQLTTDKKRDRIIKFYNSLGFKHTHIGMKMFL